MKLRMLGIFAAATIGGSLAANSAKADTITFGDLSVGSLVTGTATSGHKITYVIDLSSLGAVYGGGGDTFEIGGFTGFLTFDTSGNSITSTTTAQDTGTVAGDTWDIKYVAGNLIGTNVGQGNTKLYDGPKTPLLTFSLLAVGDEPVVVSTFSSQDHKLQAPVTMEVPITGQSAEVVAVPVPAAAWTGFSTLLGVAGLALIRRRRLA